VKEVGWAVRAGCLGRSSVVSTGSQRCAKKRRKVRGSGSSLWEEEILPLDLCEKGKKSPNLWPCEGNTIVAVSSLCLVSLWGSCEVIRGSIPLTPTVGSVLGQSWPDS